MIKLNKYSPAVKIGAHSHAKNNKKKKNLKVNLRKYY